MNNPSNALRKETLSGNSQTSHYPPGFHSYLPALFQVRVRAFHSFCALLITPLSARITVGLGDERGTKQEDRCSHGFSLRLWMGWGENTSTGLFLCVFLLCPHWDDSCCCALDKPYSLCHSVGMYRSGHVLFFLSLKEESHRSLVEVSANNSDPVTWNLLTKVRKSKERELPIKETQHCRQQLQNTSACTASELWSTSFRVQAWNA